MPKRPRSHQLEAEARRQLKDLFDGSEGWSINDLHEDYGEDLLVRIFEEEKATPFSFYVQSKATDSIHRFKKKSLRFSVPISTAHLEQWSGFWEPVFLTLYDSRSRKTYWECIQVFLEGRKGSKRLKKFNKSVTIDIPETNLLDKRGLRRILNITKARFRRHRDEEAGAKVLLSLLEERAGLQAIEYSPSSGMLWLKDRKKRSEVVFFGRMQPVIDFLIEREGSFNRWFKGALIRMEKSFKKDRKTGNVTILDDNGLVREQYATLEDYHLEERVQKELEGPDHLVARILRLRRHLSQRTRSRPRA